MITELIRRPTRIDCGPVRAPVAPIQWPDGVAHRFRMAVRASGRVRQPNSMAGAVRTISETVATTGRRVSPVSSYTSPQWVRELCT